MRVNRGIGGKTEGEVHMKKSMQHRSRQHNPVVYHIMLLPGMSFLLIFSFIPMLGIVMAFQDFVPAGGIFGSRWVGLENFKFMFLIPDGKQVFINTLVIAVSKIVLSMSVSIVFALLLNEIRHIGYKRAVQTIVYLPNFLSWVVLAPVVLGIFDYYGPLASLFRYFGYEPVLFLASNTWFRPIIVFSDVWKGFGYGAIVYLASLTSIDPGLYEAAAIDGAGRWKRLLNITLPSLAPTIVLLSVMNLANILNAGFDQIFNLYNPMVYETADIIDTYVYRVGMVQRNYSLGTAVGLLKSVLSFILILSSNEMAKKLTDRRIF